MDTRPTNTAGEKEPSAKLVPDSIQDMRTLPTTPGPLTKKHTTLLLILAIILFLLLVGGSISLILFLQSRPLTLTEADAGRTIQVHRGDQITLQLRANESTGFQWAIERTDPTVLTLQSTTYTLDPSEPGRTGRGGTQTFLFKAQQSGTVHLQLKYWRSWQGDSSIAQRYRVTLQVQG